MVRVRFAPSPTGYLHVGGARTALFNWLFARHHGGAFILRIEDTDQERSTEESIDEISKAMRWLGLDWDEYYRQTERAELHQRAAETLLEQGAVYERDGAWWFRVPTDGETVVHDELLGDVAFQNMQLEDFVIRRSDGSFIYNFVVVVDDADMGITDVIRGDEHLNNTPKQILLYRALGRSTPRFAHLPMILGLDRAKLSKRHGVTSVLEYQRRGLLPETMINFLARLGWSHGDQEVFTRDELIALFGLDSVGKSAAVFDEAKLHWLNQRHLKAADPGRLRALLEPLLLEETGVDQAMWDAAAPARIDRAIVLLRDRAATLRDLAEVLTMLFPVSVAPEERLIPTPEEADVLAAVADRLAAQDPFSPSGVEDAIRTALAEKGSKLKAVAKYVRMAATGRAVGPGLFDILSVIGRDLVVARLRALLSEAA
jgi:glutamyl-tRNA synthetase